MVDQSDQPAPTTSRRAVFAVVSAGVVMANLDLLIVNVAVPNIQRDFAGDSIADLSWVLNGYAIVFAALLVPAGRMSDRLGPKSSFLMGVTLFTFASALCALSTGVAMLVGARCLQAAGAAAMVPTSLALLMGTYPPEKRSTAIRLWAAVGGVAAALGPVVGGLLVTISWRWVFLINLPIGIVTVLVGRRVLTKSPVRLAGRLPDLFGALILLAAIGLLSLGIVKAPEWGWLSASVFGCIGVGVAPIRRQLSHPCFSALPSQRCSYLRSFGCKTHGNGPVYSLASPSHQGPPCFPSWPSLPHHWPAKSARAYLQRSGLSHSPAESTGGPDR
jgi:MFS family permease